MDKEIIGFASIVVLAIIMIASLLSGNDGTIRLAVVSIIGLIAGSIFGFSYAKKDTGA